MCNPKVAHFSLELFGNSWSAGLVLERLSSHNTVRFRYIVKRSSLANPNKNTNTRGTFNFKLNFCIFT